MSDELTQLGEEVAQHLLRKGPRLDVDRGAERLMRTRRSTAPRASKPLVFAALSMVAMVAVVLVLWWRGPTPLTYVVEHGSMQFSDGTVVRLAKDTSTQVKRVDAHGAEIELTKGQLTADVRTQPDARWELRAGPYAVQVTGTRFTMAWDPPAHRLTVVMYEGSVVVRGPHLGHAHALTAPARLAVSSSVGILDDPAPSPAVASVATSPAPPRAVPSASTSAPRPPIPPAPSAGDLLEAAQAARLQGDAARSRQLLQRLRTAFPQSVEARTATFMSGRMHFDAGHPAAAISDLRAYLTQGGPFSDEAEVLLILALDDAGQVAEAKARAKRLIEARPNSAHARRVQELLE